MMEKGFGFRSCRLEAYMSGLTHEHLSKSFGFGGFKNQLCKSRIDRVEVV